jgi:hypothetical protein
MTRWHGTNSAAALRAHACAAARTAVGRPAFAANSVYVIGAPAGTVRRTSHALARKLPLLCWRTGTASMASRSPSK